MQFIPTFPTRGLVPRAGGQGLESSRPGLEEGLFERTAATLGDRGGDTGSPTGADVPPQGAPRGANRGTSGAPGGFVTLAALGLLGSREDHRAAGDGGQSTAVDAPGGGPTPIAVALPGGGGITGAAGTPSGDASVGAIGPAGEGSASGASGADGTLRGGPAAGAGATGGPAASGAATGGPAASAGATGGPAAGGAGAIQTGVQDQTGVSTAKTGAPPAEGRAEKPTDGEGIAKTTGRAQAIGSGSPGSGARDLRAGSPVAAGGGQGDRPGHVSHPGPGSARGDVRHPSFRAPRTTASSPRAVSGIGGRAQESGGRPAAVAPSPQPWAGRTTHAAGIRAEADPGSTSSAPKSVSVETSDGRLHMRFEVTGEGVSSGAPSAARSGNARHVTTPSMPSIALDDAAARERALGGRSAARPSGPSGHSAVAGSAGATAGTGRLAPGALGFPDVRRSTTNGIAASPARSTNAAPAPIRASSGPGAPVPSGPDGTAPSAADGKARSVAGGTAPLAAGGTAPSAAKAMEAGLRGKDATGLSVDGIPRISGESASSSQAVFQGPREASTISRSHSPRFTDPDARPAHTPGSRPGNPGSDLPRTVVDRPFFERPLVEQPVVRRATHAMPMGSAALRANGHGPAGRNTPSGAPATVPSQETRAQTQLRAPAPALARARVQAPPAAASPMPTPAAAMSGGRSGGTAPGRAPELTSAPAATTARPEQPSGAAEPRSSGSALAWALRQGAAGRGDAGSPSQTPQQGVNQTVEATRGGDPPAQAHGSGIRQSADGRAGGSGPWWLRADAQADGATPAESSLRQAPTGAAADRPPVARSIETAPQGVGSKTLESEVASHPMNSSSQVGGERVVGADARPAGPARAGRPRSGSAEGGPSQRPIQGLTEELAPRPSHLRSGGSQRQGAAHDASLRQGAAQDAGFSQDAQPGGRPASAAPSSGGGTAGSTGLTQGARMQEAIDPSTMHQRSDAVRLQTAYWVRASLQMNQRQSVVTLDPPELGRLRITLERIGERMTARILAERPEVESMLREGREQIRERLSGQGVRVDALLIETPAARISRGAAGGDPGASHSQAHTQDHGGAHTSPHDGRNASQQGAHDRGVPGGPSEEPQIGEQGRQVDAPARSHRWRRLGLDVRA